MLRTPKEEARRAKNRMASKRARDRKKRQEQEFYEEYQELVATNRQLVEEINRLRSMLAEQSIVVRK